MKRSVFITLLSVLLLLMLSLASCAAIAKENNSGMIDGYDRIYDMDESKPGKGSSGGAIFDGNYSKDTNLGGSNSGGEYVRQVIKTYNIKSETREFEDTLSALREKVNNYSGYFENTNIVNRSFYDSNRYSRTAYYTIRIPADSADAFLADIGGMLNIVEDTSKVTDVSAEYYDLESRLRSLRAQREALEKLYAQATDIDYLLKVEERLSHVIQDIEAYETRLNYYKNQVSYSTINLTITEVIEYSVKPVTFSERIAASFKDSWRDFIDGLQDFAVGVVYSIPGLLSLAVIIAAIVIFIRLMIRRRRRRREK